jgi:hypothetical protein
MNELLQWVPGIVKGLSRSLEPIGTLVRTDLRSSQCFVNASSYIIPSQTMARRQQGEWPHATPHTRAPGWIIDQQMWDRYELSHTTFHYLMVESMPRPPPPALPRTVILFLDGAGKDFVFANCMCCSKRNFTEDNYPHPYSVGLDHPGTALLGGCGCVVCNGCVEAAMRLGPMYCDSVECPYCKYPFAFDTVTKLWITNLEVMHSYDPVIVPVTEPNPVEPWSESELGPTDNDSE